MRPRSGFLPSPLTGLLVAALLVGSACQNDKPVTQSWTSSNSTFGDLLVTSASTYQGPADSTQTLRLALFLQRDETALDAYARQVIDPASPNHRQFLTTAEIQSRFGPTGQTQQQVLNFMQSHGVTMTVGAAGILVHGEVTIEVLSRIFSTSFGRYSRSGGIFVAPITSPTLPQGLQGVVTHVVGLSTEPGLDSNSNSVVSTNGDQRSTGTRSGCSAADKGLTPSQYLTAYGIQALQNSGLTGQGVYMAMVEETLFLQANVNQFTTCFSIANPVTPQVITIGAAPTAYGVEPHLDVEIVLSAAPQLSGLYVFQSKVTSVADWAKLFAAPLDTSNTGGNRVTILSSSLGKCELRWTQAGITAMEKVMKTLAVGGISVFSAAGDSGSSGCYKGDKNITALSTVYPATSAYVTAVGGTNLALSTANALTGSGVWNDTLWGFTHPVYAGGGGGTSTMVEAPSWQTGTGTGRTMRTVPDVAMLGDPYPGYAIYTTSGGSGSTSAWIADGGTSAATPLMAGGVALLQQRAAQNNTTLDLAYRWIYRLANNSANYQSGFYDLTVNNNDLFNLGCCNAGVGYDMASGWGSVNFSSLSTLLIGS